MHQYNQTRSFNVGIAVDLSIEAALLYDELSFLADKGSREDGYIYKNLEELVQRFPFISESTIRRRIDDLVENGYIEKKVMKVNGAPTMHFRITKIASFVHLEQKEMSNENKSKEMSKVDNSIYTATHQQLTDINISSDESDESEKSEKYDWRYRQKLFEGLVEALGFTKSVRATPQRLRKLRIRLKTYSPTELIDAAKNIRSDAFMQGENAGGKRYGDIDYLLRSDEVVDKWLQMNVKEEVYRADW